MRLVLHTAIFHISIHAPAEGATSAPFTKMELTTISIHAPAEGATSWHRKSIRHKRFQSTLPRRERHSFKYCSRVIHSISIHAPAEGATLCMVPCHSSTHISIHAPAEGATRLGVSESVIANIISIHAPAEGATQSPTLRY